MGPDLSTQRSGLFYCRFETHLNHLFLFDMRLIGIWIICLFMGGTISAQQRTDKGSNLPRLVHFYPNPATTYIQFEIPASHTNETVLEVYNFLGKKIIALPSVQAKARIDLSAFTRGIYIFQLKDKTGKIIESGKFQIEK